MRFVETVSGEFFHQIENLVGFGFGQVVFGRTVTENLAMPCHFCRIFFTHGTAQQVGSSQRVSADHLGHLHDLFLINHDAVSL